MICDKEKCSGCYACYNICPKKCIKMIEDEFGYNRSNISCCLRHLQSTAYGMHWIYYDEYIKENENCIDI